MSCAIEGCEKPIAKTGLCNAHYQRKWKHGDPLGGRQPNDKCRAPSCDKVPRSRTAALCEMHYMRLRRNGSFDPIGAAHAIGHTNGYRLVYAPDHPLARPRHPHVYEHRKVFYDARGDGPFNCHVCGIAVTWADMDVDHLNDVRDDNRIENLAPACDVCNPWRGKDKASSTRRKRHARWIEFRGERLPLVDWARRLSIAPGNLARRIKSGWPLERALTEPRGKHGPLPARPSQ